jgi:hypothetical protein
LNIQLLDHLLYDIFHFLIAAFLASLLHFGPKHIPMLPDKLRTDPRVSRLAKELGVKATADGMTAIYKELEQLVTPLFEQLVTDMKNLPEEKVRVKEFDNTLLKEESIEATNVVSI